VKATITRQALLPLLARCQSVAEKRSPTPALGCTLLRAHDGQLSASATDLRMAVIGAAPSRVATSGAVAVEARALICRPSRQLARRLTESASSMTARRSLRERARGTYSMRSEPCRPTRSRSGSTESSIRSCCEATDSTPS